MIDKGVSAVVPVTDPITGEALTDQRRLARIVDATVDVEPTDSSFTNATGAAGFGTSD